jgi:hypothetical protein
MDEDLPENQLPSEEELRAKAERLASLLAEEKYRSRLHPIELILADSVSKEYRHLRCGGCHRWIDSFLEKIENIDANENSLSALFRMIP